MKKEDIHQRKSLKKGQKILDHMGSNGAGGESVPGDPGGGKIAPGQSAGEGRRKPDALAKWGAKVRQTIRELGGTMPENLPVADSSKKIETKERKRIGNKDVPEKKRKR